MSEDGAARGSAERRSPAVVRAEMADLRRYLAETPPHHGAGVRVSLELRLATLERELAGLDAPGPDRRHSRSG